MLSIKNATTNDIALIRELTMKIWPQTYIPIIGEVQVNYMLNRFYTPEALTAQMGEGGQQFVFCYSDEVPVAFAAYGKTEPDVVKLHKIYILPDQQGKGIGKFMINHIASQLKNDGFTDLILNVNRYNTSAMSFYEKVGFTSFKEEDIDIGDGYFMNDYVLWLPL